MARPRLRKLLCLSALSASASAVCFNGAVLSAGPSEDKHEDKDKRAQLRSIPPRDPDAAISPDAREQPHTEVA